MFTLIPRRDEHEGPRAEQFISEFFFLLVFSLFKKSFILRSRRILLVDVYFYCARPAACPVSQCLPISP